MREYVEFRVGEEFAPKLFADNEGKRLGDTVRKVELVTNDPRFRRIGELQRETRAITGQSFFYGWILHHQYTKQEIASAKIFHFKITTAFEPAGEECGTKYNESAACPKCRAGAPQLTPLYLPEKRIPKSKDVSRTIAGEIVVSRRVKELFARHGITGAQLNSVRYSQKSSAESSDWFQLVLTHTDAEVVAPTRTGIDPFDEDEKGEFRCPNGDTIGLNLLSEVSIKASTKPEVDIIGTHQFFSYRTGLLRPKRQILISPRLYQLLEAEKIKGYKVEVAHLK
ncbi:MAG: hypothetical protein JO232_13845 [Verrucomicrobia bacterium]|nr:hypothetical protein [Verrucomicrobiota bacterium]